MFPLKNCGGESKELNITIEEISLFFLRGGGVTCRMNALQINTLDDAPSSFPPCPTSAELYFLPGQQVRSCGILFLLQTRHSPNKLSRHTNPWCRTIKGERSAHTPVKNRVVKHPMLTHTSWRNTHPPNGRKSKRTYPTALSPCSFSCVPTQSSPNSFTVRLSADMYSTYSSFLHFRAC